MRKLAFILSAIMVFLLTGCFALPAEAPVLPPPTIAQPVERIFYTVPVMRGDIRLEENPLAFYMPARVESQRFATDGVPVLGIFVSVGDEVLQGDIIAELDFAEVGRELDELNRSHARLALEIELLTERRDLARHQARRAGEIFNDAGFVTSLNSLHADYETSARVLAYFNQLNEERYLRAGIDGTITDAATFIDGMLSNSRQIIAVISDQAFTSFVVRGSAAVLMNPGDQFEMTLGDEIFMMEVVDPDDFGFIRTGRPGNEHGAEAFLVFASTRPGTHFEEQGRVHMPLEEATDVLYIPSSFLRRFDEREFIFVLEDDIRTIRDVVAGLEADGFIEIISGLEEGELVIQ